MKCDVIDLSHPIRANMPPWPGTPPVEIKWLDRTSDTKPGERHSNSTRFTMNIHCGTHIDAPFHFIDQGRCVDRIPLERVHGPATRVDLRHKGAGSHIESADLARWEPQLRRTRKAILHTGWSAHWTKPDFFSQYPDIAVDAARLLVEWGVELVGVEPASVDYQPHETHVMLLGNDVVIVENLANLDRIRGSEFLFCAFPLNIEGRDGSPVRAVAILSS